MNQGAIDQRRKMTIEISKILSRHIFTKRTDEEEDELQKLIFYRKLIVCDHHWPDGAFAGDWDDSYLWIRCEICDKQL